MSQMTVLFFTKLRRDLHIWSSRFKVQNQQNLTTFTSIKTEKSALSLRSLMISMSIHTEI